MASNEQLQRIREVVASIPPGRVANYGQIAELAGVARGARQVARALRLSSEPLPWHRVLRSSGDIAFPRDSGLFEEQVERLSEEGVTVLGGRVNMRLFRWRPDLDEVIWGMP